MDERPEQIDHFEVEEHEGPVSIDALGEARRVKQAEKTESSMKVEFGSRRGRLVSHFVYWGIHASCLFALYTGVEPDFAVMETALLAAMEQTA